MGDTLKEIRYLLNRANNKMHEYKTKFEKQKKITETHTVQDLKDLLNNVMDSDVVVQDCLDEKSLVIKDNELLIKNSKVTTKVKDLIGVLNTLENLSEVEIQNQKIDSVVKVKNKVILSLR